jgi:cholesterol transport system auxiliary component
MRGTPARSTGVALVLLGALLLPGCGALKRAPVEKRYFVLDAARPDPQPHAEDGPILYLRTLKVSPLFEETRLVYRKSDGTYERDFHNQFFVLPAHMITEEVGQWLEASGFLRKVTRSLAIHQGSYAVTGHVDELYGDYSGDTPKAVLAIEFIAIRSAETIEILFDKTYRREVSISSGPDELVRGWNEALVPILTEFEQDLRQVDFSADD